MSKLLLVIPFSANDGVLAEHLIDFIFLVNKRQRRHHALLIVAGDVHGEMREKVRIAAEVAFESFEMLGAANVEEPDKHKRINRLFKTAATFVKNTYRLPWFWMEPDCVPLKAGWFETIAEAYFNQPKRYCGSWLKSRDLFLARVACYPPDAIDDFSEQLVLETSAAFNMHMGSIVIPRSTKTRLVQEVAFTDESVQISDEAVMLHHDKNAVLMTRLREQFEKAASKPAKGRK